MSVDWHRLFGLVLTDFFAGSPFVVELEKELSLKKQFLDVVILRQGKGRFNGRLPDGFDDLAAHNLITFKSHHEALDDWALKELTGHYVNYRKQLSPPGQPLLPEKEFRLYAVCSRYPHNLASEVSWQELQPGVYQCQRGTDAIRVVVAGQLAGGRAQRTVAPVQRRYQTGCVSGGVATSSARATPARCSSNCSRGIRARG